MCLQNVTEPQAQNITKRTHCESGLDMSMLHRGKSQLPNFSADLLSVPPVWPLFLQQSQLPISPAELLSSLQSGLSFFSNLSCQSLLLNYSLSLQCGLSFFNMQPRLPISPAELLSVPPVWPRALFLQQSVQLPISSSC